MPAGSAGGHVELARRAELGFRDLHLVQKYLPRFLRDAAQGGVADGPRLLVNFLEHEMLEAALFRHDGVPGDVLHLALDGASLEIAELDSAGSDGRQISVSQKENITGVIQNRRHV